MARDFGPFPTKPMYEVVNRRMQKALAEATSSTGFAKTSQGAVTAGTGAQLVIAAYPDGALVDGLYVENPASETVTLTTNTGSTNPRIDRLVLRLDMTAETIAPFQIVGTPGASPQIPPLVQTATTYDMPLCRYTMPGSGSAQNPGGIVDERRFLSAGPTLLWSNDNAPPSGGVASGVNGTGAVNALGPIPEHAPGPIRVLVTGQVNLSSTTPVAGFLRVALGNTSASPDLGGIGIRHRFHNNGAAPVLSYTVDACTYSDGSPKYLWLLAWSDPASGTAYTVGTGSWQVWLL